MQSILRFLSFSLTFIGCVVRLEPQCKRPPTTPCCYNEYLVPDKKRCKVCEPGSIGWNCRERCVRGYYGLLCRQKCACSSDHCDPVVGCLTTAMATSASGVATEEDDRKPHEVTGSQPSHTSSDKEGIFPTQSMTKDPTNPYRSARMTLIKVSTTIRKDTITDGHTDNERRSTDDLLGNSLSLLMTLMVVALFLLVVALAFIMGLLSFITLKLRKGVQIPTDSSPFPQPWGNLESGYMVLGRRKRPLTSDRQSGYTNPISREVVGTTSI